MLVDGAAFPRVLYPLRRLTLTKFTLPILRGARTGTVLKAAKAFDLEKKWATSSIAQKFAARQTRANLSDYDRFAVMINRKRRAFTVRQIAKGASGAKKVAAKKAKK